MQRPRSPYQVLNVSPDAEPEVIEAAYKILMKKYHPDRQTGGQDRAAELNQAFNILRDPQRRARHDSEEKARRFPLQPDGLPDPQRAAPSLSPQATAIRHPPVGDRRNRGGLIAVGAVLLGVLAAAFAIAREPSGLTAQAIGKRVQAAAEQVQDATDGDAPISSQRIEDAVAALDRVRALYGPNGIAAYSDACFEAQSRTEDIRDFDFCVAFDHAASIYVDEATLPTPHFSEAQLTLRHVGAARHLPQNDYSGVEERLRDIRSFTFRALARQAEADLPAASPASARLGQGKPRRSSPRRPRAKDRQRPQAVAQESDFIERQGGIY